MEATSEENQLHLPENIINEIFVDGGSVLADERGTAAPVDNAQEAAKVQEESAIEEGQDVKLNVVVENLTHIRQNVAIQANELVNDYVSTGLLNYLKKNTIGKEVLKAYEKNKSTGFLPRTIRSKLVRLIIARERDWLLKDIDETQKLDKFVITRERFEILANEISHIFKGESVSTYYVPFAQEGQTRSLASGKLWYHFNYAKECLRAASLLKNRKKEVSTYTVTTGDIENLNWLSVNLEPWDQVLTIWKQTFESRRRLMKELQIHEYVNRFPCLKSQNGKQMFFLDFTKLYPQNPFIQIVKWCTIRQCLVQHLGTSNIKAIQDIALLETLKSNDLSEEKQNFVTLYLLPYLIPPKRCGKRKKSNDAPDRPHRLSVEERRESFILNVQTANDLQPRLNEIRQRLLKNKQTFQPFIISVGSVTNVQALYVAVNEQLYLVDTILNAIHLALAVFFSLDCQYPENSQTIWTVLQRIFVDIKLPTDVLNIQSNIVLGHIENTLKS